MQESKYARNLLSVSEQQQQQQYRSKQNPHEWTPAPVVSHLRRRRLLLLCVWAPEAAISLEALTRGGPAAANQRTEPAPSTPLSPFSSFQFHFSFSPSARLCFSCVPSCGFGSPFGFLYFSRWSGNMWSGLSAWICVLRMWKIVLHRCFWVGRVFLIFFPLWLFVIFFNFFV